MSARDNGGPAFPGYHFTGAYHYPNDGSPPAAITEPHIGMTLRDYFAAKAMQGILSDPAIDHPAEQLATFSYAIADAMLKARAA